VLPEGLGQLKKMHSSDRVSNSRPSGLQHCALTTTLLVPNTSNELGKFSKGAINSTSGRTPTFSGGIEENNEKLQSR
jgi:hypothetical protein